MDYFVYILKCSDKSLYTGIATDIKRRLREHNGKVKGGAIYTRSRRPVRLKHFEKFNSRSSALKREAEIKRMTRAQKKILINY